MATPLELRLGLIGCGTVGGAFASALAERRDTIERQHGVRLVLREIAVAHPARPRLHSHDARLHGDGAAIAEDPAIDIVVEASGADAASGWIRSALGRGAAVVTANKQAIARDCALLAALAAGERRLLCEGAVAAAVPIVRALRESLAGEEVLSIRGVLNGTTTYILSRLERGERFADALAAAQEAGYAELDPTSDLSGADAAAKLAILCTIAWREPVTIDRVRVRGIDEEIASLVEDAAAHGARVRLVASAQRTTHPAAHEALGAGEARGALQARVEPRLLEPSDPLASATDVCNVVQVRSALAGPLTWLGAGAGGAGTASALLGDVIAAATAIRRGRALPPAGLAVPSSARVAAEAAA